MTDDFDTNFMAKHSFCERCGKPFSEVQPNWVPGFKHPLGCIPCREKTKTLKTVASERIRTAEIREARKAKYEAEAAEVLRKIKAGEGPYGSQKKKDD